MHRNQGADRRHIFPPDGVIVLGFLRLADAETDNVLHDALLMARLIALIFLICPYPSTYAVPESPLGRAEQGT